MMFGGVELLNNSRVRGIAESAQPCPMFWLRGPECTTLADALGQVGDYTWARINQAPWYDPDLPDLSSRFFGVYAYSFTGVYDSTRRADVTESTLNGGVIGATRKGSKRVTVRALVMANGQDALEYGMAWLNGTLDPDGCGKVGGTCETSDIEFFAACPPARPTVPALDGGYGHGAYGSGSYGFGPSSSPDIPMPDAEYAAIVDGYRRYLKGASVISGPLITDTKTRGDFWAHWVEFTFAVEKPWVYQKTEPLTLTPSLPSVVQDVPYNLAPYPSAELPSGTVIVAENLSTNPSVETNATGWNAIGAAVSGAAPSIAGARSRELAASGSASFLATATGAGVAVHDVICYQDVAVAPVAGSRYSLTLWGAMLFTGSGGSGVSLGASVEWRDSGGVVLRTDMLGTPITSAFAGQVFAIKSVAPPSGAVIARVILAGRANFTASTIAKVFADALAVSIP